jgi:hypothetical protein
MRQYHRDMANLRDHRIRAVGWTLLKTLGMHMNVGNDRTAGFPAMLPERAELAPVYDHNARIKRVRIDIVIIDEFLNRPPVAFAAKEKCAAFPAGVKRSPAQLGDAGAPDG